MAIYDSGDKVRLSAIFTTTANATGDPGGVTLRLLKPDGTSGVLVYNTDTALVREATGVYYWETGLVSPGTYFYRWEASGNLQAAEEASFTVRQSRF